MGAMMMPHIDKLPGGFHSCEGSLDYRLRRPDKSHYRPVGCLSRIYIQNFNSLYGSYFRHNLIYYFLIPPLAEVRDAFNYSLHFLWLFNLRQFRLA